MRPLKIAQIAPPFISVPPDGYGGTEAVVSTITEELVKRGHDVTLFAAGSSKTSATLVAPFKEALTPPITDNLFSPLAHKLFWMHSLPYMYHISAAFDRAQEFDIIHDHTHYMSIFYKKLCSTPIISTYHGSLHWASESPIERLILEKYKDHNWVAISKAQQNFSGVDLHVSAVIHHGIDPNLFAYTDTASDAFVWLGRITKQKGIEDAISAVKATGKKLVVSGIVNDRDKEFYTSKIEPHFDGTTIRYAGPSNHEQKSKLLSQSKALLYPLLWEEPFGLVMIESMATGTPVIAYARGAAPEIVTDGVTGFLINSSEKDRRGDYIIKKSGREGLQEAIEKIATMSTQAYTAMRKAARQDVEKRFTVERMVDMYEQLYAHILHL